MHEFQGKTGRKELSLTPHEGNLLNDKSSLF